MTLVTYLSFRGLKTGRLKKGHNAIQQHCMHCIHFNLETDDWDISRSDDVSDWPFIWKCVGALLSPKSVVIQFKLNGYCVILSVRSILSSLNHLCNHQIFSLQAQSKITQSELVFQTYESSFKGARSHSQPIKYGSLISGPSLSSLTLQLPSFLKALVKCKSVNNCFELRYVSYVTYYTYV